MQAFISKCTNTEAEGQWVQSQPVLESKLTISMGYKVRLSQNKKGKAGWGYSLRWEDYPLKDLAFDLKIEKRGNK